MMDKVIAFATKWAVLLIIGAVLLLGVTGYLIWHRHQIEKNAAAGANAKTQVEKANSDNAHDAIGVIVEHGKTDTKTDDITRTNNDIIHKTPGAAVGLNPELDAAGRRALCMRPSAAHLPECQQLLHPHTP